jgi:hypothetical protein
MSTHTLLVGAAFLSFVLATAGAPIPRVNLTALGLTFWSLAALLTGTP